MSIALTRRPRVGGPDPCCPVSRTPGLLLVRKGLLQKGALGAEVGARPLGYSSTKQQALTDSVLGDWGVIDRSLQSSPDL